MELRLSNPGLARRLAEKRRRHSALALDGRLVIVAADHPGRRVMAAGGDPWAMGELDPAAMAVRLAERVRGRAVGEVVRWPGLWPSP